jgi:ribonuclease E
MAENTIKSTNPEKTETGKGEELSVITRIGKWLTGQKDSKKVETEEKQENTAAPEGAAQTGGSEKPVSRPRKRGPRRRSGRGRKRPAQPAKDEIVAVKKQDQGEVPEPGLRPAPEADLSLEPEEIPEDLEEAVTPSDDNVKRKLLINTDEPEECRIAMIENGVVEAFYVETMHHAQTKGNIYKGRIVSIEPSLQAAFVDFGEGKNGFLSFNDIHPEYFRGGDAKKHWKDVEIEKALRKGDEVLVQVVKEAVGNKGANMTTFLSLAGRYLVLMPGSDSSGISRKIESESQREKLRKLVDSMELPEGIGYIVRTASKEITKAAVSEDLKFLLNLWSEIKDRGQKQPSPSLVYKEQDIISRFLRDQYTPDIQEILVDNEEVFRKVQNFLDLIPGRKKTTARLYGGTKPIFNNYQIEKQIEQIYHPTVNLPSGGSIVITPTEALVAIDVNSGRTSKDKNFEESIFLANMEAAEELARQLRLRDLGGLIVVDFIDMREAKHVREVEKKVKNSMKKDRAKVDISRISKFGLMQISRQKMASPVQRGSYNVCECCQGRGLVRSVETQALVYLRRIQTAVLRKEVKRVECRLPLAVAQYLQNRKRSELVALEGRYEVVINIVGDPAISPTDGQVETIRG